MVETGSFPWRFDANSFRVPAGAIAATVEVRLLGTSGELWADDPAVALQ